VAFKEYFALAQTGDPKAQTKLGLCMLLARVRVYKKILSNLSSGTASSKSGFMRRPNTIWELYILLGMVYLKIKSWLLSGTVKRQSRATPMHRVTLGICTALVTGY
jgi:hypothetical protein